jgi:hypothetical protein
VPPCFEEVEGSVDVRLVRADWIGKGPRHTGKRCHVKNDVDSLDCLSAHVGVANIGHAKIDTIGNLIEVALESRDEVIEDSYGVTEVE